MILPGWTCSCGVFCGEGKSALAKCRACGAEGPEVMSWERAREAAVATLAGKPYRSYVETARQLAAFVENGTRTHKVFEKS
jgi:hypothetical protein